jgi:calcineurin-like phosphoesterase family protein
MKVWLISDTHFGHANIIKYTNRPFKDVEEMNENLIVCWNSLVKKDDIVYHLGDFAMGGAEKIESLTARLNGRKMLILGNHDSNAATWYMKHGFEWATRFPIIFEKFFILSHEPLFMEANSPYVNAHGHIHQHKYADTEHYYNCSVEHHAYKPVAFEDILESLKPNAFKERHQDLQMKEPWMEDK